MKKLKIAICGCLGHAEKFGNLINSYPESATTAIWDNIPERGKAAARNLGVPFEADYDRLLREYGLSGVVIPAENCFHKEMILKAAEQGVSVFVEKPLCVDPADAREIQRAIRASGVKFYMTDPFVRSGTLFLKELMGRGTLGEITGARVRLGVTGALESREDYPIYDKARSFGGIMADVGGHAIHIAHFLFGKPAGLSAVLSSYTEKGRRTGIEENAVTVMRYPDGKLVTLECSWLSAGENSVTEVYGTLGWARVTKRGQEEGDDLVVWQLGKEPPREAYGSNLPENPKRHVRYFVEMLAGDLPNDIVGVDPLSNSGVSIDNAVEYVEIIDAVYRSAERGYTEL